MAVNGIAMSSSQAAERSAHLNFNRFNTNVMLDNMDRMNEGQRAISQELRDMLTNANRNDDDGINFSLYSKEDEDNKNASKNKEPHHMIIRNPGLSMLKAPGRTSSPAECETCANRRYQDGSDENDVSFKTPAKIAPSIAASVILGHEHEHVANAYEKEYNTNHGVHSHGSHDHVHAHVDQASVRLKTDICPECGRVYFSGGVTNTVISFTDDEQFYDPYQPYKSFDEENQNQQGSNVDFNS